LLINFYFSFFKSFLFKGFYVELNELRELVGPLIKYLNSSSDVNSEEEEK